MAKFGWNILTKISGPPPVVPVILNIPKPNRAFHLYSNWNFQSLWHNGKHPVRKKYVKNAQSLIGISMTGGGYLEKFPSIEYVWIFSVTTLWLFGQWFTTNRCTLLQAAIYNKLLCNSHTAVDIAFCRSANLIFWNLQNLTAINPFLFSTQRVTTVQPQMVDTPENMTEDFTHVSKVHTDDQLT